MNGRDIEKQNPHRRMRRLPCCRRFEPQGLRVAPNGACLLKVRSFLAIALNVVATHYGKETQKDNIDSECSLLHWWTQGRVSS